MKFEPPTQVVRSKSWVARSLTTPTSLIRFGNGPILLVLIWKRSPNSPSFILSRMLRIAGLNRSMWPTAPTRPASVKEAVIRFAPSESIASGFSTSVCTPASHSCRATSSCSLVGHATTAKSIFLSSNSGTDPTRREVSMVPVVSPTGSAIPTNVT